MTRTITYALCSANVALLLLAGCGRDSSDAKSGSSRDDAGESRDSSTPLAPNELQDAAISSDAGRTGVDRDAGPAASGGRGGQGNSGGSGGQAEPEPPPPTAGAAGSDDAHGGGGQPAQGGSEAEPGGDAGSEPPPEGLCTTCGACEEVQRVVSTMHTTMRVSYTDPPPTSGPHNPCWARWGRHDEPLLPERWVHNLEHGGVVFLYNCPEGCPDDVEALATIAAKRSRHILAAYPELPKRFAVVSWGHRLVSDCLDTAAFAEFYTNNFDRGPESNANPPNPGCPP